MVVVGRIFVSNHAMERFQERSVYAGVKFKPTREKLVEMLALSADDDTISDIHRTLRIINNGFRETKYLRYKHWRFVLEKSTTPEYEYVLKTVERVKSHEC